MFERGVQALRRGLDGNAPCAIGPKHGKRPPVDLADVLLGADAPGNDRKRPFRPVFERGPGNGLKFAFRHHADKTNGNALATGFEE